MAIDIRIRAWLDQRQVDRDADNIASAYEKAGDRAGAGLERGISRGAERGAIAAERALNRVNDLQERLNKARAEYNNIAVRSDVDDNRIIASKKKIVDLEIAHGKAIRDSALSQRAAASAQDAAASSLNKVNRAAKEATDSVAGLGKTGFQVGRGGLLIGLAALGPTLIDTAKLAVTASQSIYLLPAALTAAGTAMGTLKLATMGFSDAIGDIGNADKFAEDLAKLSPNAQQAALSIKAILPELKALQSATQDSFFDGFAGQIERLESVYLPQVQKVTTGVAGAFNDMINNVGDQMLTPDMQANFSLIGSNINQMFQNLVPAATSIAQAFTDITATGSSFLPGLAKDISDTAATFANFISEARQSGQLAEWIREGIEAVKLLGDAIWTLGSFIYDVFGKDGQQNINDFKDTLAGVQEVLNALAGDFGNFNDSLNGDSWTFGADIREELDKMVGVAAAVRDAINNIPGALRLAENVFIDFANTVSGAINNGPIKAINNLIGNITRTLNMLPDWMVGKDKPADFGQISNIPTIDNLAPEPWKVWSTQPNNTPGGQFSNDKYSGPTDPGQVKPREYTMPDGTVMVPGPAGVGGWVPKSSVPQPRTPGGPYDVPAPPPTDRNGKPLSDKERRDQIAAGLDPSLWKVDPGVTPMGLPAGGAGPMPGGGYGPGAKYQQDVLEANHNVITQAHDLEESKKDRLALERDNTATAKEIEDAKWKELQDTWALQKAQADLADKIHGTSTKTKNGIDQLGVALDPDMGLGQGLSGFADNLTRMVGNMIMRPFMEAQQAIVDADPIKGGFGLLGIMGAKNIANGLSPLLGRPYDSSGSSAYAAATGTGTPASSTYPGDAALLAAVPKGIGQYDNGVKDLSKGLVDCSSGVEDLVNLLDGKSTAGGSLTTGSAASVLPGMGFVPGMGGPGDFRIGYNSHHMQATLPGGSNVNFGSTSAIRAGGLDGGQGAYDPSFTDHWFRPAGATAAMPGGGGAAGLAGAGGATPVFVVNMPGSGISLPGGAGGPGGAPGGLPGGGSGFNWDAIAGAEASGNWANKSNPKYQGGLQFDPSTWAKVKPAGAPANAADATREQQIAAAEALMATGATPASQWPATFKAHPEWFQSGGASPGGVDPRISTNTSAALDNPPAPLGNPADLFTGGGGRGPIFRKPQGGPPATPGTDLFSPGGILGGSSTDMSSLDPNSPTGLGSYNNILPGAGQTGNGWGGLDPNSPVGATGAPGNIGPFPVPQSVVPGVGNSAQYGLGPGFQPNVGPGPLQPNASANPTQIGGLQSGVAMGGSGGIGASDSTMALAGLAASGLDVLAPGAGQAAQVGMKLANRAIQYGGQLAGIGVSGLMETFLPTGGSELANSGWLPRIIGGLAGAKPALPNTAGQPGGKEAPPPLTPQQALAQHMGNGNGSPGPGNQINVEYNSVGQTEDRNAADLTHHLGNLATGGMAGKP